MTEVAKIRVDDLSLVRGTRPTLDRVSVCFDEPGLIALAGPNGAGKSTLLKVLAGLLRPTKVRHLTLDDTPIATLSHRDRARAIAYLPQERTVHWNMTARAMIDLGRLPHRRPGAAPSLADRNAVERALNAVDATSLADRPILSLSGGERARVLIARALAQEARVLLADEPAAGLDPAHHWALFECLARVANDGTRVVVATHDLAMIDRFATQVVLLAEGRLIAHAPPRAVLTAEQLASVYGIAATLNDGALRQTGVLR